MPLLFSYHTFATSGWLALLRSFQDVETGKKEGVGGVGEGEESNRQAVLRTVTILHFPCQSPSLRLLVRLLGSSHSSRSVFLLSLHLTLIRGSSRLLPRGADDGRSSRSPAPTHTQTPKLRAPVIIAIIISSCRHIRISPAAAAAAATAAVGCSCQSESGFPCYRAAHRSPLTFHRNTGSTATRPPPLFFLPPLPLRVMSAWGGWGRNEGNKERKKIQRSNSRRCRL
ncbi:hypothetical protein VTK26DRAFT_6339 [Humicola hyalothermophila]